MRGYFGLILQNRNDGINSWQTVRWQSNPQKMNPLLLLGMLAVAVMSGTVQASNGTNVTVGDPTSGSLNASYQLPSIFGSITWNRMRTSYSPSYSYYPEFYQWNSLPGCKLLCGPFSWPIYAGGVILCQRNLSAYSMNNIGNQPYKNYCVPDVNGATLGCSGATFYLSTKLQGLSCKYSVISGDSQYSAISSTYPWDCCQNNNNDDPYPSSLNVFADLGAVIL